MVSSLGGVLTISFIFRVGFCRWSKRTGRRPPTILDGIVLREIRQTSGPPTTPFDVPPLGTCCFIINTSFGLLLTCAGWSNRGERINCLKWKTDLIDLSKSSPDLH